MSGYVDLHSQNKHAATLIKDPALSRLEFASGFLMATYSLWLVSQATLAGSRNRVTALI